MQRLAYQKKLSHCWHGPYRLVQQLSPVTFNICTADNQLLSTPVHVDRFKIFYDPADRPMQPPVDLELEHALVLHESELPRDSIIPSQIQAPLPASQPGDNFYPIEKVLKHRIGKGTIESLVKWQDFSSKHNSWIPTSSIVDLTQTTDKK